MRPRVRFLDLHDERLRFIAINRIRMEDLPGFVPWRGVDDLARFDARVGMDCIACMVYAERWTRREIRADGNRAERAGLGKVRVDRAADKLHDLEVERCHE